MIFKENISHQLDVVGGVKAHSIIFKGNQPTEPYAYFLAYASTDGNLFDPEFYPRASERYEGDRDQYRQRTKHSF